MENELIKVEVKNDTQVVSARELHKGLEIAQRFSRWVSNNWDMFEEGVDYVGCTLSTPFNSKHPDGTQKAVMHTKWTQKGRLGLYELLKQNGILPLIEMED